MTTTSEAKSFAGDGALKLFSDAPGYDEVVKRFVVEMWNGDDASGCIVKGDAVEEVLRLSLEHAYALPRALEASTSVESSAVESKLGVKGKRARKKAARKARKEDEREKAAKEAEFLESAMARVLEEVEASRESACATTGATECSGEDESTGAGAVEGGTTPASRCVSRCESVTASSVSASSVSASSCASSCESTGSTVVEEGRESEVVDGVAAEGKVEGAFEGKSEVLEGQLEGGKVECQLGGGKVECQLEGGKVEGALEGALVGGGGESEGSAPLVKLEPVFVRTLSGKTVVLEVGPGESLMRVFVRYAVSTGEVADRFVWRGRQLTVNMLMPAGVARHDTLHALGRLRGGGDAEGSFKPYAPGQAEAIFEAGIGGQLRERMPESIKRSYYGTHKLEYVERLTLGSFIVGNFDKDIAYALLRPRVGNEGNQRELRRWLLELASGRRDHVDYYYDVRRCEWLYQGGHANLARRLHHTLDSWQCAPRHFPHRCWVVLLDGSQNVGVRTKR